MASDRAKCDNCDFEQKHIFICAFSGANFHLKYACLKCKKIISSHDYLKDCPVCKSELEPCKKSHREGYYLCPKCGKRKLKFYRETVS